MSFNPENTAILGASSAIESALTKHLSEKHPNASIFAFSRHGAAYSIDYRSESSLAEAAELTAKDRPLDLAIVSKGILHDKRLMPEKSLRDLSAKKFQRFFEANTITPTLIATPEYSAKKLLEVLENISPKQTEKCFAWDSQEILL